MGAADQQRYRPGRVAGGGQQRQRPVAHHVQRFAERRQTGILGGLHGDLAPVQAGQLDVAAHKAAQLRAGLGQLGTFGGGHQQVGAGQLGQSADVVLVEVRQDSGIHVGRGVAERGELRGQSVMLADVEPGEPVVQVAGEAAGEVMVIGDRGAVLPGVEQDQPAGVLDDVDVDRPWRGPLPGCQQPPVHRLTAAVGVFGPDLHGPGADHRHRLHRSRLRPRGQNVHGLRLPLGWPSAQ